MANMICSQCSCGCLILPYSCLHDRQGRLKDLKVENYPEILESVNAFVLIGDEYDGILGHDCFMALCENIKQAQEQANEYSENIIDATGEQTQFWYYLDSKWDALLKNMYFQQLYAAYAMFYYYYLGIASSETSTIGDIKHKLQGSQVNDGDGGENIGLQDSNAKSQKMLTIAKKWTALFRKHFWNKSQNMYNCTDIKCHPHIDTHEHKCSCKKSTCQSCNPYPEKPRVTRPRAYWL